MALNHIYLTRQLFPGCRSLLLPTTTGPEVKYKRLAAFLLTYNEIEGEVLRLAGMELIFSTVAGMGLCAGFVLETVSITPGCFRPC